MPPETNVKKNSDGFSVLYRMIAIDDDRLERLYAWIDEVPLSRPKKNIARDFADGVLAAEVIFHFCPRFIHIHNYRPSNSVITKEYNWFTLNSSLHVLASPAVLLAEIIHYFLPKLVELHNYGASVGLRRNEANLCLLNRKVLAKLQMELSPEVIRAVARGQALAIENVLTVLRDHIDIHLAKQKQRRHRPIWLDDSAEVEIRDVYASSPDVVPYIPIHGDSSSRQSKSVPWLPSLKTPRTQESLPRGILQEKQEEVNVKLETIDMLQQKIERLEHLCYLKDIRIEDLHKKVQTVEEEVSRVPVPPAKLKLQKRPPQGQLYHGNHSLPRHGNRQLQQTHS